MSIKFQPLAWVYHDGWNFVEQFSKDSLNPADKKPLDKTANYYQMGHCHLFLPSFNVNVKAANANTRAYSGEQIYQFQVEDEWGPNAKDVNYGNAYTLKGKPIWYFYIEQYWRRMYVQPWDQEDVNCKFPLNQSYNYETYPEEQYINKLVSAIDNAIIQVDDNDSLYENKLLLDLVESEYCYYLSSQYLTAVRNKNARISWYKDNYNIIDELNKRLPPPNENKDREEEIDSSVYYIINGGELLLNLYNTYYFSKMEENNGWIDKLETLKVFINNVYQQSNNQNSFGRFLNDELKQEITTYCKGEYKKDVYNNIHIKSKQSVGHVGIKYDASNNNHSLGPFREGGEFYFFNTVVNRTMPCEYWLDEKQGKRQYYIKKKSDKKQEDTTGRQTWQFSSDKNCFLWVNNLFSETDNTLNYSDEMQEIPEEEQEQNNNPEEVYIIKGQTGWGEYYHNTNEPFDWNPKNDWTKQEKYWKLDQKLYKNNYGQAYVKNHVRRDDGTFRIGNANYISNPVPSNSKRLRNDRYHYSNNIWIGNNNQVMLNSATGEEIHWENPENGWSGWYEYGEIIKCVQDGNYYKRNWEPYNYQLNDGYDEKDEFPMKIKVKKNGNSIEVEQIEMCGNFTYWDRLKRQWFPNPSPWLCNDSNIINQDPEYDQNSSSSSSSMSLTDLIKQWTKSAVYKDSEANRLHLLYEEYCHYYHLINYLGKHITYVWHYKIRECDSIWSGYSSSSTNIVDEYFSDEIDEELVDSKIQELQDLIEDSKNNYEGDDYYYDDYYEYELQRLEKFKNYNIAGNKIHLYWESVIKEFYETYNRFPEFEEEESLFEEFINNLPSTPGNPIYSFKKILNNSGYESDEPLDKIGSVNPVYYKDEMVYYYYDLEDAYLEYEGYSQVINPKKLTNNEYLAHEAALIHRNKLLNLIKIHMGDYQLSENVLTYFYDSQTEKKLNSLLMRNNEYIQMIGNYITINEYHPLSSVTRQELAKAINGFIKPNIQTFFEVSDKHIDLSYSGAEKLSIWGGQNPEYLSYINFKDFCEVWAPLTEEELEQQNFEEDMPQRNNVPYPPCDEFTGSHHELISMIEYISKNGVSNIINDCEILFDEGDNDVSFKFERNGRFYVESAMGDDGKTTEYKLLKNYDNSKVDNEEFSILEQIYEFITKQYARIWGVKEEINLDDYDEYKLDEEGNAVLGSGNDFNEDNSEDDFDSVSIPDDYLKISEMTFKYQELIKSIEKCLDEQPYFNLLMPFYPRIDTTIHKFNESLPEGFPAFYTLSHLDEGDIRYFGNRKYKLKSNNSLRPFDPYRGADEKVVYDEETKKWFEKLRSPDDEQSENGISPIKVWKRYYNKREIYTIPTLTTAKGGEKIHAARVPLSGRGGYEVIPSGHATTASYSNEDGARRLYSNEKFISPIIEYQKIIRLNWQRMPEYQSQETKYNFNPFDESYDISELWRTTEDCSWGDGFNVTVKIPFTVNNEVKSPFSQPNKPTLPIGQYAGGDSIILPENKMRYNIDFYDSLDKIMLYDYPNYIKIMHSFQELFLPEGYNDDPTADSWTKYDYSLYQESYVSQDIKRINEDRHNSLSPVYYEDFPDRAKNLYRDFVINKLFPNNENNEQQEGLDQTVIEERLNYTHYEWHELIDYYFKNIFLTNGFTIFNPVLEKPVDSFENFPFENIPIVNDFDCFGNKTQVHTFVNVDGKYMWCEEQRHLLPSAKQVATYTDKDGNPIIGYINSKGELVKGGSIVQFNNPTGVQPDGIWVEQCLGAIVKTRCLQIVEDSLGYRYQKLTDEGDTAILPDEPLTGADYKG